jgi:hypothetical protein
LRSDDRVDDVGRVAAVLGPVRGVEVVVGTRVGVGERESLLTPAASTCPAWVAWAPRYQAAVGPFTDRAYRSSPRRTTQTGRALLSVPSGRRNASRISSVSPILLSSSLVHVVIAVRLLGVESAGTTGSFGKIIPNVSD